MSGLKTRRAISSIISSAILLTATVLMGTGMVSWSNTNFSSSKVELVNVYSEKANKIQENISIEKIWFGTTPQKFVNVTMTNQSPLSIVINQVQFSTTSGTTKIPVNNQLIMPGKSSSLKITYSYAVNIPTTVNIFTARNSTFSTVILPQ